MGLADWLKSLVFVAIQIYKNFTYNIVIELQKTIKKSMATGMAAEMLQK